MIRRPVDALGDDAEDAVRAISYLGHVLLDDYHDVNPSQEQLIRETHSRSTTLFAVGDGCFRREVLPTALPAPLNRA